MQYELLYWYRFEHCLRFEIAGGLGLPLIWSTHRAQVWEEKFYLHVEVYVQIFRLHINFRSEEPNIVDLNLLLTVPNEKGSRGERSLILCDLRWDQVVMVDVRRAFHFALLLFRKPRREHAIWVRIVQLYKFSLWCNLKNEKESIQTNRKKCPLPLHLSCYRLTPSGSRGPRRKGQCFWRSPGVPRSPV